MRRIESENSTLHTQALDVYLFVQPVLLSSTFSKLIIRSHRNAFLSLNMVIGNMFWTLSCQIYIYGKDNLYQAVLRSLRGYNRLIINQKTLRNRDYPQNNKVLLNEIPHNCVGDHNPLPTTSSVAIVSVAIKVTIYPYPQINSRPHSLFIIIKITQILWTFCI